MLKEDELYTNKISARKENDIYSDENQNKLFFIFTLLFMILAIGYLMYQSTKGSEDIIRNTKVLGVSYIPEDIDKKEQTKEYRVKYINKQNISTTDDKDEYRDATVVDDKKEYTRVVIVKNPI